MPNCRPGDLAYIIPEKVGVAELKNRFVYVIRPAVNGEISHYSNGMPVYAKMRPDQLTWFVSAANGERLPQRIRLTDKLLSTSKIVLEYIPEVVIEDSSLRPIRDPGDDAVDEMLRPLPASHEPQTTD